MSPCRRWSTNPGMRPARRAERGSTRTSTVADQREPPGPIARTRTGATPTGRASDTRRGPGATRTRGPSRPPDCTWTALVPEPTRTATRPKLTGGADRTGGGGGAWAITGTRAPSARSARSRPRGCGG